MSFDLTQAVFMVLVCRPLRNFKEIAVDNVDMRVRKQSYCFNVTRTSEKSFSKLSLSSSK